MYLRPNFDNINLIFNLRRRPTFSEERLTFYEWEAGDTLDGVAYEHLGDPRLKWAIIDANPQYRSEFDIKVGDSIRIPDYDEVIDYVDVDDVDSDVEEEDVDYE